MSDFSKGFKYCYSYHSDSDTPPLISINSNDGPVVRVLKENKKLKDFISDKGFVKKNFSNLKRQKNLNSTDG